jgi:hypothetical protein
MNRQVVPDDFRRALHSRDVSGVQSQLLLRRANDEDFIAPTEVMLWKRYKQCERYLQQYEAYFKREMAENALSLDESLHQVERSLVIKVYSGLWGIYAAEAVWMVQRLREVLSAHPRSDEHPTLDRTISIGGER